MNKIEYFYAAIKAKCYYKKEWAISIFAILGSQPKINSFYPYKIVQTPTGIFFTTNGTSNDLVKITDAKPGEPLFKFSDVITVTKELCPNIQEDKIETRIGNLLFNLIALVENFGTKIPYINTKVSISAIEDFLAGVLNDEPDLESSKDPNKFYIGEYNKFINSLSFLKGYSQLCVHADSVKTILPPSGIKEFKAELLKKYAGKLHDPVEVAKFEKELINYDAEWLKGDASGETFASSGKMRNIVRKKLFLTVGTERGFIDKTEVTPIINSLSEGWDIKQFEQYINSLRVGSYGRGAETMLGGELAKWLFRASSNAMITDKDCGTKLGMRTFIKPDIYKQLLGKYLIEDEELILVETEEQAKTYINKTVIIRSPMFCKETKTDFCPVCLGKKLAANKDGISLAVSEYGSSLLLISMSSFHGKALSLAKFDLNKIH